MYSTAYITGADWNDTRFFDEGFDEIIFAARAELDEARRAELYRDAATKVRDDGGLILPMFNDFLDARPGGGPGLGPRSEPRDVQSEGPRSASGSNRRRTGPWGAGVPS